MNVERSDEMMEKLGFKFPKLNSELSEKDS